MASRPMTGEEMNDSDESNWYGPESATFGDRLAAAREFSGLSQSDLAKRLGVKKSTLRAWEEDLSEPRANRLTMMSGILNVSIRWLLTSEGDGPEGLSEESEVPKDIRALLAEIRDVRAQMVSSAERLARLEKRLRAKIEEAQY